jgi:hypothetical protein
MSSPKAAVRATTPKSASLAALLSPGRAAASRKNGAKSRGPKTPEGKARASRNALKHSLRAEQFIVVEGESAEAFAAFEAALVDDLAPLGAMQTLLVGRIVRAAWRLERAERIEAELFARAMFAEGDLGLALIRDGNGARAFDTLLRYRGTAQAEFSRALRLLKALQAEAAPQEAARHCEGAGRPAPHPSRHLSPETSNKPEVRGNPGDLRYEPGRVPASPGAIGPAVPATPRDGTATPKKQPDEPKSRRIPCESARPVESALSQGPKSAAALAQTAESAAPLLASTVLASRRHGRAGTVLNKAFPQAIP